MPPSLDRGSSRYYTTTRYGQNLDHFHLRRGEILSTDFAEQMEVYVRIAGDSRQFRQQAAGNHYVVFPGQAEESWRLGA